MGACWVGNMFWKPWGGRPMFETPGGRPMGMPGTIPGKPPPNMAMYCCMARGSIWPFAGGGGMEGGGAMEPGWGNPTSGLAPAAPGPIWPIWA